VSGVRPIARTPGSPGRAHASAGFAATSLMADTSTRAASLPCWSINHAARSVSNRAWSISTREWPIQSCTLAKSLQVLAECLARQRARTHQFQRQFALADRAHAMVYAAGTEAALRSAKPLPSCPSRFDTGTRTSFNTTSQ